MIYTEGLIDPFSLLPTAALAKARGPIKSEPPTRLHRCMFPKATLCFVRVQLCEKSLTRGSDPKPAAQAPPYFGSDNFKPDLISCDGQVGWAGCIRSELGDPTCVFVFVSVSREWIVLAHSRVAFSHRSSEDAAPNHAVRGRTHHFRN